MNSFLKAALLVSVCSNALAQLKTVTISHPEFDFQRYSTKQSLQEISYDPLEIQAATDTYYFHTFGSLKSSVKGNLTQIRYMSNTNEDASFQIWNIGDNGVPTMKSLLKQTTTTIEGDIKILTGIFPQEIEVGDMLGVWIDNAYPVIAWKTTQQVTSDYFVVYNGWTTRVTPEEAFASTSGPPAVTDTSKAYMAALEITIEYNEADQPTTTSSSTTMTTTPSTTTTTTEKTTTTPKTTTTTALKPEVEVSTTKKVSSTTTTDAEVITDANTEKKDLSDELLYIIIAVPIAVVVLLVIIITAVLCVRRKQARDNEKIAELKRSYQNGTSAYSDSCSSGSDMVHDYEITDAYQYSQPVSNAAFTSADTLQHGGVYAQINKSSTLHRPKNEAVISAPEVESPKDEVIMVGIDNYITADSQPTQATIELFDNELYTAC